MTNQIIEKIAAKYGIENLLDLLVDKFSGSDFSSLLIEVFRRRSQKLTPADLLNSYSQNRFVQTANVPTLAFQRFELKMLEHLSKHGFDILEFSPTAPLGTCSVLGTISQNLILGASRNTEVVADITNLMALETARRKKKNSQLEEVSFAAAHRLTRCQPPLEEKHTAHFKILCLTTSGRDNGNSLFEVQALAKHINTHLATFNEVLGIDKQQLKVKLIKLENQNIQKLDSIASRILPLCDTENVEVVEVSHTEKIYYRDFQFQINFLVDGQEHFIVDGGLVDWTQQLLANKKERFMTSGMGTEYLFKVLADNQT